MSELKTQPEEKTYQYQTKNEMCIHFILPCYFLNQKEKKSQTIFSSSTTMILIFLSISFLLIIIHTTRRLSTPSYGGVHAELMRHRKLEIFTPFYKLQKRIHEISGTTVFSAGKVKTNDVPFPNRALKGRESLP